ncbi:hypothetical protein QBC33DRAFT_548938 [Phialemonium atrogriseum]|uniref:Uncharacterized protein n=1 Tax=Phialemonium atrogriseum TaxID=1093897 RepID=A0AAJ0BTE8_9PEZI|nr:uncharacterized protein QBC33DRAFT_548938 [Phialemonium atrogriseum]KAK1763682.1 hypothetical protein QBC33DRAFT_548938 [Phialemonium atrogriseum]
MKSPHSVSPPPGCHYRPVPGPGIVHTLREQANYKNLQSLALIFSGWLDVDTLPSHLIILRRSYVSIRFAQAFRRFDSEVMAVERKLQILQDEEKTKGSVQVQRNCSLAKMLQLVIF